MTYRPLIAWVCLMAVATADKVPDLLRFTNGDQLRGRFMGLKQGPQVIWKNDDLATSADFKVDRIRQIVLRGGRPVSPLTTLAHLTLVNGDRFPGKVTAVDAETITLDTPYAGTIQIPRDQVSILAANPLGGRIFYQGPFSEDEWRIATAFTPEQIEELRRNERSKAARKTGPWLFTGSAWHWQNKHVGTALVRDSGMPERSTLRFEVSWKNRLNLTIPFHADFAQSKNKPIDQKKVNNKWHLNPMDASIVSHIFGNSYVLQLYNNYFSLCRSGVDEPLKADIDRDQRDTRNFRLGDTGTARIEIRSNCRSGEIMLFVNDEFIAQWNGFHLQDENLPRNATEKPFPSKGLGFGFMVLGDNLPTRISDIVVTEWNGMPDAARSLQSDDKDIVLMTNGTDRYAGKVGSLDKEGKVLFEGRHGHFQFPLEDVAEIRFARNNLTSLAAPPPSNLIVRFGPIGSVSGQGISGDENSIELLNAAAGKLKLNTEATTLIEFNPTNMLFDDWNPDF